MKTICKDLLDEYQALDDLVSGLDTAAWDTLTPFAGWTVKDEISHIAYFDQQAVLSVLNPEIFRDHLDILMHEFVSFEDLYAKINAVGDGCPVRNCWGGGAMRGRLCLRRLTISKARPGCPGTGRP
jgi:hypothetical protein